MCEESRGQGAYEAAGEKGAQCHCPPARRACGGVKTRNVSNDLYTAAFKFFSGIQKEKGPQKAGALAIVGMLHAGAQCL